MEDVNPIAVVYQDGDSVSFTVSVSSSFWKDDCMEEEDTRHWLAVDYTGTNGESECVASKNIGCGQEQAEAAGLYTAQCDDTGHAIVDLYVDDGNDLALGAVEEVRRHAEEEEEEGVVEVPMACAHWKGRQSSACRFRYQIQCEQNPCSSDDHHEHHHHHHQDGGHSEGLPRRRVLRGYGRD